MDLDDDELKATRKMNGVDKKDIKTCMQQLEIHIANELDDEQWDNWNEVLKYIKDLDESADYNWEQYQDIGKMYFDLKEKIENILSSMKEEHDKAIERFMKEDIYHVPANGDVAQELGYFIGKIEELLEEES